MGTIYGYKNKLWKVINEFKYTGNYETFTLNKGEYLFICNGAKGGLGINSTHINRGGSSYGVIEITEPTTFYAVVGGDGESSVKEYVEPAGGFNGGGNGGLPCLYRNNPYNSGAGGGGGTDIRIIEPQGSVGDNSIYYRIIVAGGGGGGHFIAPTGQYINFTGFGGGVNGGYPFASANTPNDRLYPSQTDGYDFWCGMNGEPNIMTTSGTSSMYGASGGGGGWYGGYSPGATSSINYSSANGGGGSGYILTELSYKPENYMKDVDIEKFYFKNIFMNSGSAEESSVIICTPIDVPNKGDKIIFPCVGEMTSFNLPKGKYKISCWGGDGGTRYTSEYSARGGYVEGILTNPKIQKVYAVVGGSATFASSDMPVEYVQSTLPTIGFNGGGPPSGITGIQQSATAGGGGTDIRIGSDSLYSRVIVAGGAGGMGNINSRAGAGGGDTGGFHSSSGHGTAPGPGTQTGSPISNDTRINGGFGYGGNGVSQNSGHGGAGGGGWYGGSGVVPDTSGDDDKAGAGGSGFIFTENSIVPDDYLLTNEYMMTQPISVQGGNNLPIGLTKIEIDVLEASTCKMICKDAEGIKYFNESNEKWEYLSDDEITIDIINEHGTYEIINEDGLLNNYQVYVLDNNDTVDTLKNKVVPSKQYIRTTKYTPMLVSRITMDSDIPDGTDLQIKTSRKGIAEDAHIDLTIEVESFDESISDTRIYCVQAYGTGESSGYKQLPKKEKTLEQIDLLPVGIGNNMPSRYKSYIGGFLNNGVAIQTVNSAMSCERNRNIYSCVLVNNTTLRFTKLNLITNKSTIIKDIPKSLLGNTYYGGMLVDDNYIYITSSVNGNSTLWRISLDLNDNTVNTYSYSSLADYYFSAYGKMEWYNAYTICICCRKGFLLFDTNKLLWDSKLYTTLSNKSDMALGTKYALSIYTNDNTSTALICDIETNTWKDLSTGFGITLSGKNQSCCCYAEGKFYITQKNYLHIIDEETMTLEKVVVTPYSSIAPKTINYGLGILYITITNSQTLYMYDINNDNFQSTSLPFTINAWTTNNFCRPTSFRGYFFIPNLRLYVINFVEYAKYNIGYKYNQFMFITNEEYESDYEYDNRFVTFNDTHINVHTGYISKKLNKINEEGNIKMCEFDKSEYNVFLSSELSKEDIDES